MTQRLNTFLIAVNVFGLIALGSCFRIWQLERVPGINGDEAWYGIRAQELLAGQLDTWWTPTGNLLNPFYFSMVVLLHAFFPPSFALLRIPPLATGLATLLANLAICRSVFSARTAWISTAILAVLPVSIAYSRFGWDSSQSILATLLPMYVGLAALECARPYRVLTLAVVLQIAACWVHPTNVFSFPIILASAAEIGLGRLSERRWYAGYLFVVVLAIATCLVAGTAWVNDLFEFFAQIPRLFTGVTIYRFITGATQAGAPVTSVFGGRAYDAVATTLFCVLLAGCIFVARGGSRRTCTRVLLIGTALGLAAFYRITGLKGLTPGYERYGIWMVAPLVLSFSLGIDAAMEKRRPTALLAVVPLAWLLLIGFAYNYFGFVAQTGGRAHRCFRTSATEPKLQAFDLMARHSGGQATVWIVANEWWTYQPIRYLTMADPRFRMIGSTAEFQSEADRIPATDTLWLVAFVGTDSERELTSVVKTLPGEWDEWRIGDSAGGPLLSVRRRLPRREDKMRNAPEAARGSPPG